MMVVTAKAKPFEAYELDSSTVAELEVPCGMHGYLAP